MVGTGVRWLDVFVRTRLRSFLGVLVSVGLIACLLVGSVLLALFLTAQIAQESKLAVVKVNEMVRLTGERAALEVGS